MSVTDVDEVRRVVVPVGERSRPAAGVGRLRVRQGIKVEAVLELGPGHRGEQCPRVGVNGALEQGLAGGDLHQASRAHHRDAVGHVVHHREVVRDEDIGQAELALEVLQQVQHLGLHRDVERGHRLVADEELGLEGEGARNADALALSAGEAVRIATQPAGIEPGEGHEGPSPSRPATRDRRSRG